MEFTCYKSDPRDSSIGCVHHIVHMFILTSIVHLTKRDEYKGYRNGKRH